MPKSGKVIAGKLVPGGTRVAVDVLSANLSAENFTLPDGFYPERWYHELREPGQFFERDQCQVVKPVSLISCLSAAFFGFGQVMLIMAIVLSWSS